MVKRLVGYVRTSTLEQELHGNGLEAQINAIEAYVRGISEAAKWSGNEELDLIEIVEEPASSGSSLKKRPKLQSLLKRIDNREVDGVVVMKIDRLARNTIELLEMNRDHFEPHNCSIISIKENVDTSTPVGKLVFTILGGMAEFELDVIKERTMGGIDEKAKKGQHASGRLALGYKSSVDEKGNKIMVIDESEAQIVEMIFQLKDIEGLSYHKIADHLNDKGYKTKNDKQWYASSVRVIHTNPKYKGVYVYNRSKAPIVVPNEDIRIIGPNTLEKEFEEVMEVLA